MQIHRISFYDDFGCTAGKCIHSCCRGWMIPLTQEDIYRFRHEKGALKLALYAARSHSGMQCFNSGSGTCRFHTRDGLCSLQLKRGHDFIPEACRMFPRFYRNYGVFEERYIDPSCIEGARLLIENAQNLSLAESVGDPLSAPCTTNDDEGFLNGLVHTRQLMLNSLKDITGADGLNRAMNAIFKYSRSLQEAFLKGEASFLSSHPFTLEYAEENIQLFPFDTELFKDIMGTSFYHVKLRRTNPFLYSLCRLYFDKYHSLMSSADAWKDAADDFAAKHKEAVLSGTAYYAYYLYLYYLKSYEDYSFIRNVSMGMIHANMIFMFSVLYALNDPDRYPQCLPGIISMYDRRACFNDEIADEMYRCLLSLTD